jgi:hypothetical protein
MPDGTFNGTSCQPLNPFAEYRVAVNDYIAQGGSGFAVLKRNTTKFNTGISLRDALIDYIRTLPNRCDPTQFTNILGVSCRDSKGELYDCTALCCCHDAESGPRCSSDPSCPQYAACLQSGVSPEAFDLTNAPCLDGTVQAHDGRINPVQGNGS